MQKNAQTSVVNALLSQVGVAGVRDLRQLCSALRALRRRRAHEVQMGVSGERWLVVVDSIGQLYDAREFAEQAAVRWA